ncbi:hypothetical protein BDR06DRAFT_974149 [Suillus hirtellus]|nr:hypothetical protein BDR06DRAFT_974149 [Suillus hirtellus]
MSPGEAQAHQPNLSCTPPCANQSSHVSNLKSTPLSHGASAASDHIGLIGAKINQICPWIEWDIKKTKTCNVTVMLGDLLQHASNDLETPQPDLLDKCLDAVLKVCNGKFSTKEKSLARYFILLTSHKVLGIKILVEGMHAASSDLEMICQHNDMPIYQKHQTKKSKWIPDVFILPSKSSKEASPDTANPPWDHRVQNAAKKLKGGQIFWKDVLASIEFKRTSNFGLEGPLALYKLEKYTPTDLEYWKVPMWEASASSATAVSSKHKAEDDEESMAKRAKTTNTDADRLLDVIVQTALYTAEMFTANIAVTHLLNLIIEVVEEGMHKTSLNGMVVKDGMHKANLGGVDLVIHTNSKERVTHYGLQGHATNVIPVTSEKLSTEFPDIKKDRMVAKIFWAEEDCISELEILKKVQKIAAKESDIKGHVPQLLWYCRFPNPTHAV